MSATVGQLLEQSPLPRLEARLLLMHATGLSRARLMAFPETVPDAQQVQQFLQLQQRRVDGEPVAYLLGEREFYGRPFRVSPAVLIPRPETEMLVDLALHHLRGVVQPRVLDLGTGSGAIAVSVALELPAAEVWAVDISAEALAVARHNAAALGARVQLLPSDWYAALDPGLHFDLILSNPPYIEADDVHLQQGDLRFEPATALTDFADGLSCLRHIYQGAVTRLRPGGRVYAEHGYNQGEACRELCRQAGLQAVETLPDLAGLDRVTGGCVSSVLAPPPAKPGLSAG